MNTNYASLAIQSVLDSRQSFCKFLSSNDSGATGGHQSGILVSKSAKEILLEQSLDNENILKRTVEIKWQNCHDTESSFAYYSSKSELRITKLGRHFPYLTPDQTGALFVLTRQNEDDYSGFFLETEDEIEQFFNTFNISPTETNRLIDKVTVSSAQREETEIETFIAKLGVDFLASCDMSAAAREIQNHVYDRSEFILTDPDRKKIDWTNMEYTLFRAIEYERYGDTIA